MLYQLSQYARYVTPASVTDECKMHMQEDFSLVTIEVVSPVMVKYRREISFSIADKISMFGIINLFLWICCYTRKKCLFRIDLQLFYKRSRKIEAQSV